MYYILGKEASIDVTVITANSILIITVMCEQAYTSIYPLPLKPLLPITDLAMHPYWNTKVLVNWTPAHNLAIRDRIAGV